MAAYVEQLDLQVQGLLTQENLGPVLNLLNSIEKITKVDKKWTIRGFLGFMAVYLIFGHAASLLSNLLGFAYPCYASLNALETVDPDDDRKWLTYWVVFASFSLVEFFSDQIFSWFPFYYLAKVVFLVWCFLPIKKNGSQVIYQRFIRPFYLRKKSEIDATVEKVVKNIADGLNFKIHPFV
ncbi:receptor expression-enhancing protein 5-like isoform X2 [Brevipalpus obovatus]|uniref:receptor expression-enhancing protein 5-like isoform X2 n=1 Tax=Brevipalpus obovatus TaxID=246614 RepID=UPI003D9ED36C